MVEHVVNIGLARLDKTSMDASLTRVLESAFLGSLGRHLVAVPVPIDMPKDRFIALLDRRVLDAARADVGLLDGAERGNTIRVVFAASRPASSSARRAHCLLRPAPQKP